MGSPQFYSRTDEFARRRISISVASFTTQSKLLSQQRVYSPVVDELLGSTVRFRNWRVHDRTLYPRCWPSEINVPALADSRQTELSAYQGTDKQGPARNSPERTPHHPGVAAERSMKGYVG